MTTPSSDNPLHKKRYKGEGSAFEAFLYFHESIRHRIRGFIILIIRATAIAIYKIISYLLLLHGNFSAAL